jgi:hypothetical protein
MEIVPGTLRKHSAARGHCERRHTVGDRILRPALFARRRAGAFRRGPRAYLA